MDNRHGRKNPNWKGEDAGYQAIHRWLRIEFGKADHCERCKKKKAKRFEWALKKGANYKRVRDLFEQLCPSCHRKQDITPAIRKRLSDAKKSKPSNARGKHWHWKRSS